MKDIDLHRIADNFISLAVSQHFEYGIVSTTDLVFGYLPCDTDMKMLIDIIWRRSSTYGTNTRHEHNIKRSLLHAINYEDKCHAVEYAYSCLHSGEHVLQEIAISFLEMTNFPNTIEELKKAVLSKWLTQYRDKVVEQLEEENGQRT